MKKLFTFRILTVLLVSHTALAATFGAARQADVSPDEYEVYSALIREEYVEEDTRLAVITDETYDPLPDSASAEQFFDELARSPLQPSLSRETSDDFVAQNRKGPQTVSRSFSLGVDYVLADYKAIAGMFVPGIDLKGSWEKFYAKYPRSHGYVRLSRAGFNRAKDQALVQMAWMCGELCGEGKFVLLVKRDGKWKIEGKYMRWVV